jgi:hypothetical protein
VTTALALAAALPPAQASAQRLSRVSLDSVGAVDLFRGDATTGHPDTSVDISSVIRVGGGWTVRLRPWFFKSSAPDAEWSHELYQAAVRYQHTGPVSARLDAGFIESPLGLGMLDMRADVNPTIQPHLSYFVPLLAFDAGAPTVGAITSTYPLGASLTLSTRRWDARVAWLDQTPSRRYALGAEYGNPSRTPTALAGGGVTLTPGLRVGASAGRGRYASAGELTGPTPAARTLTLWNVEAEYAVAYTRVSAEYTEERFSFGTERARAATWFVQGVQTLSPRWFTAARLASIRSPRGAQLPATLPVRPFVASETTLGFRLTPELTLRTSVSTSRWYLAATTDRRVGAQLVWSRRWW